MAGLACVDVITTGVARNCPDVHGQIGVNKDLILINWEDYDRVATLDPLNFETTTTNGNKDGLTKILLKAGTPVQYVFEGTDYSVKPSITSEIKEDGDTWYIHTINLMAYNKTSTARKALTDLGQSRVVAVAVDRSTGFYELFGAEQGLKVSSIARDYVGGGQNGNFYAVTLVTPDIAVIRESNMGLLCHQAPVVPV